MDIITLEEHFFAPSLYDGLDLPPGADERHPDALRDLGAGRLQDMDANGITKQVLSSLSTTGVPADVAVPRVATVNDGLADVIAEHPDRFAGFAALPTTAPDAAANELSRAVTELGFVGTLIMGRTDDEFLSAPRFEPILARAATLDVPIYLHPGLPPRATYEQNYGNFSPELSGILSAQGWGWHMETAVHFINIVLSGVLDRYPSLQFILGHWGEMIPFYLDRLDWSMPRDVTKLARTFGEYLRENVYVTPSGMFTPANLQYCVDVLGVDRIMYSVDYPFLSNDGAVAFLREAHLSEDDREKIAHGTAERVLRL